MNILKARKRLLNEKTFLQSVAIHPKKNIIVDSDDKQCQTIIFLLKLICSGKVELSLSLYNTVRTRVLFQRLVSDFEQGVLSSLNKQTRKNYIIKYLPIISLLIEAVLE